VPHPDSSGCNRTDKDKIAGTVYFFKGFLAVYGIFCNGRGLPMYLTTFLGDSFSDGFFFITVGKYGIPIFFLIKNGYTER
jgi:hypothetical protein